MESKVVKMRSISGKKIQFSKVMCKSKRRWLQDTKKKQKLREASQNSSKKKLLKLNSISKLMKKKINVNRFGMKLNLKKSL